MKHARIIFEGQTHSATENNGQLLLADGRRIGFNEVSTWLAPLPPTSRARTVLALGLNYADRCVNCA